MSKIDLHFHSYCSDGQLAPRVVINKANQAGCRVVALTDHNGVAGITEAQKAARRLEMTCLSGIEIYSIYKKRRLHILGYNFDPSSKALAKLLETVQKKHQQRVAKILTNAEKMGFFIDYQKLNKTKSVYVGWAEIIGNLQQHPKNRQKLTREIRPRADLFEVLNKYFSPGKKGYVEPIDWPASKVIITLKKAGAVVVLAHPGQQLSWAEDGLIAQLKKLGIQGVEAFTPYHNWHQVLHYQRLASDLKLIITGGTDYHGDVKDGRLVARRQWDYFQIPDKIYQQGLAKLIRKVRK
ncbi:MAG: PHP domain-containing protein [Patescibacteria group bacterium]